MGQKSRKKLDVLMVILMIVVMSYQATGNLFHEAAGSLQRNCIGCYRI